jgi:hypothetical protein
MIKQVLFTVSDSKRLLARAVVQMAEVRRAYAEGMVVVATGTTNAYVLEELLGRPIEKRAYRSGIVTPAKPERLPGPEPARIPDAVFRKGELVPDLDRFTAAPHMAAGDVFIKGANALDYDRKIAGVLIGGNDGGTIANVYGRTIGRRVKLILPIGLEKLVCGDILAACRLSIEQDGGLPLYPVTTGTIVTEIEALRTLAGVEATLLASGGIAGAEGAVRLLVEGDAEQVERALEIARSIQGEPRYLL